MTHADIAAAGPDEQRAVLEALWLTVKGNEPGRVWATEGGGWATNDRWKFWRMLEAKAYVDAALMLVPEGYEWLRKSPGTMTVYRTPADDKDWAVHHEAGGSTPALALASAIARSREA